MRRLGIIRVASSLLLAGLIADAEARGAPPGEAYALLVGVRQYEPSEPLPKLAYPEDDMEALARVLIESGYKVENVKVMTQKDGATRPRFLPTADKIRKELALTLKRLEPADSVIVALAGHGVQFTADGESFFCPADAALGDETTLISLGDLSRSLESCQAGFKLLLVDACRNNPKLAVQRALGRTVIDLPSLSRTFVRKPPGGTAAFFSCSAGEIAFEDPDLKHGVFFHYVIKGLQGEADRDADGAVDVEELASFAKKNVAKFVDLTYGKEQFPELINRTCGAVAIVHPTRPQGPPKELTNSLKMKLVRIPEGEFLMGSSKADDPDAEDDETPRHRVRITKPFYLGATEVTRGQFRQVVETAGFKTDAEKDGQGGYGWNEETKKFEGRDPKYTWRFAGFPQTDEHPVVNVTWNDAIAFCNALSEREGLKPYYAFGARAQSGGDGYRLPTEAEWEYACRAATTRYESGDDPETLAAVGNVCDATAKEMGGVFANFTGIKGRDGYVFTAPVGRFRANAFGLFDMHGNVWEWCWDGYKADYYKDSPGADPSGPSQATVRVRRGGGWSDDPRYARSAIRLGYLPVIRSNILGFRVARVRSEPR